LFIAHQQVYGASSSVHGPYIKCNYYVLAGACLQLFQMRFALTMN